MAASHDVRAFNVGVAIRRHLMLVVVVAVLCVGAAGTFALSRPTTYISTSSVVLLPLAPNNLNPATVASSTQINVAMETEAGLVTSPTVIKLVNAALGFTVAPSAVKATVPANTEIVQIQCTAATAQRAQACAQAFATQFLAYRSSQAKAQQTFELDGLRRQISAAEDNLTTATEAAQGANPPADAAAKVQLATSLLNTLQGRLGTLEVLDTNAGAFNKLAQLPSKPTGLSPLLLVGAGLAFGLAFGIALAVWRERRDDRVRTSSESTILGIPLLSSLPPAGRAMPRLLTERAPGDSLHNAYRRARTAIVAATRTPAIITVCSVPGDAHRDDVAANLALSLASAGFTVTLVDAGIHDPGVAALLDIEPGPGLSDCIATDTDSLPRTVESAGLRVLPAGTDPRRARDTYAGARLPAVLGRLRTRTDYVIVAGPTAGTPEGNSVARAGDGLILVFPDRSTTHHELGEIIDDVERLGVTLIGAISTPRQVVHRGRRATTARPSSREPAGQSAPTAAAPADGVVAAQSIEASA